MKSHDATLLAAAALLCALGAWCDAGCAADTEHETLGSSARVSPVAASLDQRCAPGNGARTTERQVQR